MAYFAQKPCSFQGKPFKIGEQIPDDLILPEAVAQLLRMGVIISLPEGGGASATKEEIVYKEEIVPKEAVQLTVSVDEGELVLNLTAPGLQQVVDALTHSVEAGEEIIAEMTEGDALILLHLTDSRKTMKKAAEERGKALAQTADNANGEDNADGAGQGEDTDSVNRED